MAFVTDKSELKPGTGADTKPIQTIGGFTKTLGVFLM
jgi:hypothetical protein